MEIGCGTGRYFHWLQNVDLLVGTDLSSEMLQKAEHPIHERDVTAKHIRLMQGNLFEMEFAPESFDFIYSLGVFGRGALWTPAIAAKIHRWLAPGGHLFFNAVEIPHCRTRVDRWKWSVKCGLYRVAPEMLQQWLIARETIPMVPHTQRQIEQVMHDAGFGKFIVSRYRCESPLWNGTHLECNALKSPAGDARLETADPSAKATVLDTANNAEQ